MGEFSEATHGLHPFDVVEALRRHEFPADLEDYRETEDAGLSVAIELAAMLLREPAEVHDSTVDFVADPVSVVEQLSLITHEILSCINLAEQYETKRGSTAARRPSSSLFSRTLFLRGNQYAHIEREHCRRFLSTPHIERFCREVLGLTYDEALIVLDASESLVKDRLIAASIELNQLLDGRGPESEAPDSRAGFLLRALYCEMGRLSSFTAGDITNKTGLSRAVVTAALDLLSYRTAALEPSDVVGLLAAGKDPMRGKAYLRLNDLFVHVNTPAATDRLRDTFEKALNTDARARDSYAKWRGRQAEEIAVDLLERILDVPATRTSLVYRNRQPDSGPIPDTAEADALFVFDSVALIVEVKSASFSSQARAGDPVRWVTDLRKIAGHGSAQASRLEKLARDDGGVELDDGTWLDLRHVVEVHKIVVSAEELGRAGIDIDALVRAEIIPEDTLPWVVSLHDLAVIAEIGELPPLFLLYLRQRTSPQISRLFTANDELDLYMLFLRGFLWAIPDPRALAVKNPMSVHVTPSSIARFEKQPEIFVQSQTDELAAWMYYSHGLRSTPAPRPAFTANRHIRQIVDFLVDGHKPGWLEFCADLLDGGAKAQKVLASALDDMLRRSNADGTEHSVSRGLAGHWGYSMFVATVALAGETPTEGMDRLKDFQLLKKYQMRSPRALGLAFLPSGELVGAQYEGSAWEFDTGMETLVTYVGLRDQRTKPLPPSARRKRRRLRS
ncbi:hypothetical protein [Cryobacterium sp. MDB2-10]|uniref:hypothetical protein n=1 Tax=Cryobacterium sp. MDB2-10 TaxID=1259177 RepID=UPI001073D121|nr:hypothetical protein [Cryobacterium sp. MDB2-10]TFC19916.1 hypothetical protein E3O51_06145 [Cryobacterium sp. MDB2-10]